MKDNNTNYFNHAVVGLDVHKKTITWALLLPQEKEAVLTGTIVNNHKAAKGLIKRINNKCEGLEIVYLYEAGCMGFTLHSWLVEMGEDCRVIAPHSIPKVVGKHKDDIRDAKMLSKYFRNGDLSEVMVPDEELQALRSLIMHRGYLVKQQTRLKVKVKMFQHLWNLNYEGNFAGDHLDFLNKAVVNLKAGASLTLNLLLNELKVCVLSLKEVEEKIEEISDYDRFKPFHDALVGFKGIRTNTAMALIAFIGDISRFSHPTQLMGYFGLVPKEHSSGESKKSGGLTKTGNKEVRRLLIEVAANQSGIYVNWKKTNWAARRKGLSVDIIEILDRAGNRLSKKYRHLANREKKFNKIKAAVARELLGFIWDLMMLVNKKQLAMMIR